MSSGKRIPHLSTPNRRELLAGAAAAVGDRDARAGRVRAAVSDGEGQHDRPRGDRYRGHGRHPAFRHRHHGDQRDRLGAGREARDRADQRRRAACSAARSSSSRRTARSDWPTFAEKAKKLLVNDKVASVMGCWTSASRKAVLPVFEQYNGMLYYPTFYEGLEQSKNVIYTGQEATQQIIAGLDWVQKEKGAKTFYLLGSDYIWPRTSNKIARKHIENFLKTEGGRRGILPARPHPVQLCHQQDQAEQAGRDLRDHRRRLQCRLLQAAQGGRLRSQQADPDDDLGHRGRNSTVSAARTSSAPMPA